MYINDVSILYYLLVGIVGIFVGQFIDWCNVRLLEYKRIFSKDFFKEYLKNHKIKYTYMIAVVLLYLLVLYEYKISITSLKFLCLIPMLISAFVIDYKEKIIPNRLNLTIFETGLLFTVIQGVFNINIAIDMLLGMLAGGGIFLLITLIGGLLAGKEAMGLRRCKIHGSNWTVFWMETNYNCFINRIFIRSYYWNNINGYKQEKIRRLYAFWSFLSNGCIDYNVCTI